MAIIMSPLQELESLYKETLEIFESDISWEAKYDLIFSERISYRVFDMISLDYHDPDEDYEDDVRAFVFAFRCKMNRDTE